MRPTRDRRQYPRYTGCKRDAQVKFRGSGEALPLVDLSWGGFCFETREELDVHAVHCFHIAVPDLPVRAATVTAQIRHIRRVNTGEFRIGAEFLSSDQAWLGPEDG